MSTDRACAPGPTRRSVVKGAGAAVVGAAAAAPVLTACGGSEKGLTLPVSEVPVGGGVIRDGYVILQPSPGQITAFGSTCPHAGCAVNEIRGTAIVCPCHGSEFSTADGSVTQGPATKGLPAAAVEVDGDSLTVS